MRELAQLPVRAGGAEAFCRYENGRVAPSLEAVVRIAETFNTSVDYFVTPDAPGGLCTLQATPSTPASQTSASSPTTSAPPSPPSSPPKLCLITGGAS